MRKAERKNISLTGQSAWILSAKFVGFALNALFPLLVVRYLTQENVGVYRQVFLVASNAALVLPLGLSMSAYYFLNRDPARHPAAVLNILIFNFLMGACAFLALFVFPQMLGATFQSPELTRMAPLIGLVIWLWIFSGFLETAALAIQEARLAAVFIVLFQLAKTFLMVAAVVWFRSVDSLIYATIVLFTLQSFALVAYLHNRFPRFWTSFDPRFFREQLAYALPFGLSVLLYVGQTDIHNYFVSHSFSAAEFAIYSVGCFQLPLISMLYESVGAVMIPRMSQLQDEDRRREMLEMTVSATQKLAFVYFPLFGYLTIVAGEFITTLFTKEYAASAAIFRVNLLVLPLFSLVVDPITRAYPHAGRFLLKVRIAICVVLLLVFWLGLGRFGLVEMISIVVAAIFVEKAACVWISIRMLKASIPDLRMLKTIGRVGLAAVIASMILFGVHLIAGERMLVSCVGLSKLVLDTIDAGRGIEFVGGSLFLGICLAVFVASYVAAANQLGAIGPDEKEKFRSVLRRLSPRRRIEHKTA